jgi:hypothetical protein
MAGSPPFYLLLVAQSLGAFSELFGQRMGRRCHNGSNIRMLLSMSFYCCIQAFIVLAVCQLALPTSWTGGQGSLSMWAMLGSHPTLWLNAVNNSVYWVALAYLLREVRAVARAPDGFVAALLLQARRSVSPGGGSCLLMSNCLVLPLPHDGHPSLQPLGAVLVVLAFLFASFLVDPFQRVVGLTAASSLRPEAVVFGVLGSLLCSWDVPPRWCAQLAAAVLGQCPIRLASRLACLCPPPAHASPGGKKPAHPASSPAASDGCDVEEVAGETAVAAFSDAGAAGAGSGGALGAEGEQQALLGSPQLVSGHGRHRVAHPLAPTASSPSSSGALTPSQGGAGDGTGSGSTPPAGPQPPCALVSHALGVAAAYVVLAITTGIGVTMATYFEQTAGLTSFGYTAIDQVLLPFTTVPLAAVLDASVRLRAMVGEPAWSPTAAKPPHFGLTLRRAWGEVNSGAPLRYWFTLVPFHGLEFLRSLLFFYLVTQFDVDATYMTMTLLRVVLCWLASLLACTLLRAFVGLDAVEARAAVHPVNIAAKLAGSGLLVVSILLQKGQVG